LEAVLLEVRFKGDSEKAKSMYTRHKPLQVEYIAAVIHFVVTRSYHVNIEDLVVYSTARASSTILNKK
jgi:3-hydroxy acid dehydrogenase/malonic semialdehyde reductase